MNSSGQKEWNNLITKRAIGIDGFDLGKVREVDYSYVITERGTAYKQWFCIPKKEVQGYDSSTVNMRVTEEDARALYLRTERIVGGPLKKPSVLKFSSLTKS